MSSAAQRPLWAITCYFRFDDPPGVKRRLRNFREFRRRLGVPLLAVELSLDGTFDLGPGDAEILVRRRGGAILWQKERLLNIALETLPADCDTVAWLDADVVFLRKDWAEATARALRRHKLIQPFRRVYHQTPGNRARVHDSIASRHAEGRLPDDVFRTAGASQRLGYSPGMAWAARRETVAAHGLYDALVLGSGDKLLFSAAFGRHEDFARVYRMNPRQADHCARWGDAFHDAVHSSVGFIEGDLLHLWHGHVRSRHYGTARYQGFDRFRFDPRVDIARNSDDVWRWNTHKPELHRFTRRYFALRGEADTRAVAAL